MAARRRSLLVPLAALALAACAAQPSEPPALMVGDVAYMESELGALSPAQRETLADLTAFGLAVARGELAGLGEPFIARERQALLLQRLATEVSLREAGMDEEALRRRYAEAPEYELTVRHLLILSERWRPEEHRAEARRRAQAALHRIRAGEDFARVAAEVSEEPGAAQRGGLLRPGREGTWVSEFWEAASALDVGQVSDVVETEYGFHVLKLEDRRPIPFEEVRERELVRLVDLAAVLAEAEAWAAREARAVQVDTAAVTAWRRNGAPDTIPLATWPGGNYRGEDFHRYLLSLAPDAYARLAAAPDDAYAGVVASAARNAFLAARAADLGIALSADEQAAVRGRWVNQATGWASALRFTSGAEPAEVKRAALAALAATQQSARIARTEVLARSRAIRAYYPVVFPPPPAAASSSEATKSDTSR